MNSGLALIPLCALSFHHHFVNVTPPANTHFGARFTFSRLGLCARRYRHVNAMGHQITIHAHVDRLCRHLSRPGTEHGDRANCARAVSASAR